MTRAVGLGRRFTVVTAAILALPIGLGAQACTPLPAERNRLWLGAGAEAGAEEGIWTVDLSFNLEGHAHISGRSRWGGYDTGDSGAGEREVQVGSILRVGPVSMCPALLGSLGSYKYLDRFGWPRGEVKQLKVGLRSGFSGYLHQGGTVEARWLATVDMIDLRWKMAGRRLEVTDSVRVVRVENRTHSTQVEGEIAAEARVGPVALSGGLASRFFDRRRFVQFIRLSVRATG